MNKKVLATVLAITTTISVATTGCSGIPGLGGDKPRSSQVIVYNQSAVKSQAEQQGIMDGFNKLLQTTNDERKFFEYVDKNIQSVSQENASKMVLGIESVQKKNYDNYVNNIFNTSETQKKIYDALPEVKDDAKDGDEHNEALPKDASFDRIGEIKSREIKKMFTEARDKGYKIIYMEENYFPIINYGVYKTYSQCVTPDVKQYIDIKAADSDTPVVAEGVLVVEWDELYKRIIDREEFMKNYPQFERIGDIKSEYVQYVAYYLFGANNTPVYDYASKEMFEESKKSYLKVDINKADSRIGQIFKEYLPLAKQYNYVLRPEVKTFIEGTVDKLKSEYK